MGIRRSFCSDEQRFRFGLCDANVEGAPMLYAACQYGQADVVKYLLHLNVNVNENDGKYDNALQAASSEVTTRSLICYAANVRISTLEADTTATRSRRHHLATTTRLSRCCSTRIQMSILKVENIVKYSKRH